MAISQWSKGTVAVVTGANKGIGLEIVRQLAKQGPTVVLTARDTERGQAAVDGLQAEGLDGVAFHQLDLASPSSVQSLASWLKSTYGGIDILINNAGATPPNLDYDSTKLVMQTNYYGVKSVIGALLPLMRSSAERARIINVTSRAGLYERLQSESIKNVFRDEENHTEKVADSLAEKYLEDRKAGRAEEEGWLAPSAGGKIYAESKMVLNLYTSTLAKSFATSQKEGHEVFVAGTCPGVCVTDMTRKAISGGYKAPSGMSIKTAAEGAETAVWLGLLPREEWQGKSGKLFADKTEFPFGRIPYVLNEAER